ncbi:insulinase family protein [Desulfovibrio ferrophilus]|uniref:Metalloprotease, iron regulated n=1 Tax=Desulfovibrio ferrophilus TaxID=241368 RepID=A0A2Z6B3Q5_9BACT|nr:metalloprotease, iron regulated [Desulfovibrio ferrophilus]
MTNIHGFTLVVEREIPEAGCVAKLWRHDTTGAELMSVLTDDENKVFGVSLRTPPSDSTGVPHILEHSVLCGSKKFPVKEPFVELLKGSLQTFLNAFTYPDKTCYPVASANLQDFYNLVDVYLDAVFHPLIPEHVFLQEGWHYELESEDGPLTRKGVVFNEMKGAYSSPDSLVYEHSQRELFPDTTYGLDSGGDPKVIPELTYEQFKRFHATYYHPSNARFWFYGDDNETERLRILGEALAGFEVLTPDSEVGFQQAWTAPRRAEHVFAGGEDSKGMFTLNWLLPETTDRELALALEMLEHVLIGLPSSPLRRALMESGLGEDLAGVGLEDELRQFFFSIGLKGIDPGNVEQAESLIMEVLEALAADGPSEAMIEAALNTVEFDLRENNSGRFPRGLSMMLHSLTTWLYNGDPFAPLAFERPIATIKERLLSGEPLFQTLIREHLLDNQHRVTVVFKPEVDLLAANEAAEQAGLASILEDFGSDQRKQVIAQAAELERLQLVEDTPEALATLPQLDLADIAPQETAIPERGRADDVLVHEIPAQGIVYLDAGFDLSAVPARLLPLVPLFGRALFETGTSREDFADLSMRIARKTGGMGHETFTSAVLGGDGAAARLFLRGKCTADNAPEMLEILREVLLDAQIGDRDRFRQILSEEKARLEQHLIPSGHLVVMSRLRARSGPAGWAAECMGGIEALMGLRELSARMDDDWDGVRADMEELKRLIVSRDGLVLNLTTDPGLCAGVEKLLSGLTESLPAGMASAADWTPGLLPAAEGLVLPAQVNYVGKVVDLRPAGYAFHGTHLTAVRMARMIYLWDAVRARGGAYGAFCFLDRFSGIMAQVSYRDPSLMQTLDAYDGLPVFFRNVDLEGEEFSKNIIGAVGDVDAYLLPDAQGFTSLLRHLTGDDMETRQHMRDQLLGTQLSDIRALGEFLEPLMAGGDVVVLGSAEAMDRAELGFTSNKVL